jgi:hypothetical protein
MNKTITILQTIRRRLKYFFSSQRRKQAKIDKLFKTRKK